MPGDEEGDENPSDEEGDASAEDPAETEDEDVDVDEGKVEDQVEEGNEPEADEEALGEAIVPEGNVVEELQPYMGTELDDLCCGGTISGVKFNDLNYDGIRDCGEPGIMGVKITLKKGCKTWHGWTDASGRYCFKHLKPGRYSVCEGGRLGYYPTTPECQDV
ncbi:MAG: SdrD B-like domain-containing protein [Actinomycetota bacterium]|nr:SdrD B-like domain-containing protein [Actinomycetota bacterium]